MKAYLWWDFSTSLNSLSYVCFIKTSKFLQTNLAQRNSAGGVSPAQQWVLQSAGEQRSRLAHVCLHFLWLKASEVYSQNHSWYPKVNATEILCFLTVIRNNILDFYLSNISSSWETLDNPGDVSQKSGLWAMSSVLLIWILAILLLLLCDKIQNMH